MVYPKNQDLCNKKENDGKEGGPPDKGYVSKELEEDLANMPLTRAIKE